MSPQLKAALDLIAACEGTNHEDGYRALFGYRPGNNRVFTSFAAHPHLFFDYTDQKGNKLKTSAAGRYQITWTTETELQAKYGFPDFSPAQQDQRAIALIDSKGALAAFEQGNLDAGLLLISGIWASLPTATVPQPHRDIAFARTAFQAAGGVLA